MNEPCRRHRWSQPCRHRSVRVWNQTSCKGHSGKRWSDISPESESEKHGKQRHEREDLYSAFFFFYNILFRWKRYSTHLERSAGGRDGSKSHDIAKVYGHRIETFCWHLHQQHITKPMKDGNAWDIQVLSFILSLSPLYIHHRGIHDASLYLR